MPKQHPVGFGWQPKPVTKLSDSIPRTLDVTLIRTFIGTMEEAVHKIEEDIIDLENTDYGAEGIGDYNMTDPKVDGWSTKLIWKELTKYGD